MKIKWILLVVLACLALLWLTSVDFSREAGEAVAESSFQINPAWWLWLAPLILGVLLLIGSIWAGKTGKANGKLKGWAKFLLVWGIVLGLYMLLLTPGAVTEPVEPLVPYLSHDNIPVEVSGAIEAQDLLIAPIYERYALPFTEEDIGKWVVFEKAVGQVNIGWGYQTPDIGWYDIEANSHFKDHMGQLELKVQRVIGPDYAVPLIIGKTDDLNFYHEGSIFYFERIVGRQRFAFRIQAWMFEDTDTILSSLGVINSVDGFRENISTGAYRLRYLLLDHSPWPDEKFDDPPLSPLLGKPRS